MKSGTLLLALGLLASVAAMLGCRPVAHVAPVAAAEDTPAEPTSLYDDLEGREVVTVVERLEQGGYVELLPNGGKRWSNLVVLAVVEPRKIDEPLRVRSQELAIGTRPLRVGDHLTFVMPPASARRGLHLLDLEKLKFRD